MERLYYADCEIRQFSATVTGCQKTEKGYAVTLDRTAFYPEGGGQACDLGTLAGVRVLDVREQGEDIIHLCEAPLETGAAVEGVLDWDRRLDLMQQHAGEHIVSGIIYKRYGYHNVGFHVGSETVTIDFDGPIPLEALWEIELAANGAVWENLPIRCWYPSREELPDVPYRRKKDIPWPVRIVEVPGYDTCACCGVHVKFTGSIGLIKLLSCVKFHQGVRIEMTCGKRALEILSRVYEQNRQVSQAFSAKIMETGEAARRMNDMLAGEKLRANNLEKQVFNAVAKEYEGKGDVVRFAEDLSAGAVRELADAIAHTCGGTAAVFSGNDETGYSVCLVNKTQDVKELGTAMAKALNGRGGGKPGYFQGSVRAKQEEIENFFAGVVKSFNIIR